MSTPFIKIIRTVLMLLVCPVVSVFAQASRLDNSQQLKAFEKALNKVGATFTFPEGFKEIKAVNNRDLQFNYAMELPGKEFELWLRVNSLKENKDFLNDNKIRVSADSAYLHLLKQQVSTLSSDENWLMRPIPPFILGGYNADVGKTYLVNLKDSPVTRHYKYALLIAIAKYNAGSLYAICLTNNKGTEFFRNMFTASNCLKFKTF